MEQILLHGTLHATIYEASNLIDKGLFGRPNLYATIDLEKTRVGRTRVIENKTSNPKWNEFFHIYCAHMASNVIFNIKKDKSIGATLIGSAYVPVQDLLDGKEVDRWVPILDENKKPIHGGESNIHVKLQYIHVTKDSNWGEGIKSPTFAGVPNTFYPQRQGCRVSLYQDTHVPDDFVPRISLDGGKDYEPHRCWEDIFDAVTNARHFIYITGWSVYTEISLVRDPKRLRPGGDIKLGELLKKKATEGVKVLLLIWDDSTSVGFIGNDGLMNTHDEGTKKYFENTKVHCVLCPRNPDVILSFFERAKTYFLFTHHQKTLVVDSEVPNGGSHQRRVVSFVGGIDLCDGRYDTCSHSLFRTLDSAHSHDFYQPSFKEASIEKGGPREPWHDIHSRLEGPIAWDVLRNFEDRWRKQGGIDVLLEQREFDEKFIPPSTVMDPDDRETWNVQLFRSIDGGSAFNFPDTPEEAARHGVVNGKNNMIDRSIQDAYIHAIRRAKNFIYIENQYFLGSSYAWSADGIKPKDIEAVHVIPKELSLKIVSKIEAEERFSVYVVVPMWPEGKPDSEQVQAILDWQRRTMEMMYKDIVQALRSKGIDQDPRNYLTFFCLGNREVKKDGEYMPTEKPRKGSKYMRAQLARRFMVYVHSKMMIVDDEYIIVGSANINQRSMDGGRDSEIAMGAYQPYHLAAARGQIHGFRMSLWHEHLGMFDQSFLHPQNEECMRKVNQLADNNWDLYSSQSFEDDLPSHLLTYPVRIGTQGDVMELPGFKFFPDTEAPILGRKSRFLPPVITTRS